MLREEFAFLFQALEKKGINKEKRKREIIVPLIPKDMFRLVCLVKLVFFAREGVAF